MAKARVPVQDWGSAIARVEEPGAPQVMPASYGWALLAIQVPKSPRRICGPPPIAIRGCSQAQAIVF